MSSALKNKPDISRSSQVDDLKNSIAIAQRSLALGDADDAQTLKAKQEALEKLSQLPTHELSGDLSKIAQASFHKFTGFTSNALSSDRLKENQAEHKKVLGMDVDAGMSMAANTLKSAMGPRWIASFADRMANFDDLNDVNAPAPIKSVLNSAQKVTSLLRDGFDTKTSEQFSKVGAELTGNYSLDLSKEELQDRIANYLSDNLGSISGKTLGMRGLVMGENGKFLNMLTQFAGFHSSDKVLDLIQKNVNITKEGKEVKATLKEEQTREFTRLCTTLAEQFHSILTLRKSADIIGGEHGKNLVKNLAKSIAGSGIHARDARGAGPASILGAAAGMGTGGILAAVRTPAFTVEAVASAKNNTGLVIEDLRNELQPEIEAKLNQNQEFVNLNPEQKELAIFEAMYPRLIEALNARAEVDAGVQAKRNTGLGLISVSLMKAGGIKNNPLKMQEGITDMNALLEANQALMEQRELLQQKAGAENLAQIESIVNTLEYQPNITTLNKSTNERLGKAKLSDIRLLATNIMGQVISSETMAVGGTVLSVATAGAVLAFPGQANTNVGLDAVGKNVSGLYQNGLGSIVDRNFNVLKSGEVITDWTIKTAANLQFAQNTAMRFAGQEAQASVVQEFVSGKPTSVVNHATYNGKSITILSGHENHSQPPAGYKTIIHNGFKFQVPSEVAANFNPSLIDISKIDAPKVDPTLNPGMSLKKAGVGNTYALELPSLKSNLATADTANDFIGTINLGNGKTIKIEGGVSNQFITLDVDGEPVKFAINGTNATAPDPITGKPKGYVELIKVSEAFANDDGFITAKIASTVGYSKETSTATFAQNESKSIDPATTTTSSSINLSNSAPTDESRFVTPQIVALNETATPKLNVTGLETPQSLRDAPSATPAPKESATAPSTIFTPPTQAQTAPLTPANPARVTETPITPTPQNKDNSSATFTFGNNKVPESFAKPAEQSSSSNPFTPSSVIPLTPGTPVKVETQTSILPKPNYSDPKLANGDPKLEVMINQGNEIEATQRARFAVENNALKELKTNEEINRAVGIIRSQANITKDRYGANSPQALEARQKAASQLRELGVLDAESNQTIVDTDQNGKTRILYLDPITGSYVEQKPNIPQQTIKANTPVFAAPTSTKVEIPNTTPISGQYSVVGENSLRATFVKEGLATTDNTGRVIVGNKPITVTLDNGQTVTYGPGEIVGTDKVIRASGNGALKADQLSSLKVGITSINGSATTAPVNTPNPSSKTPLFTIPSTLPKPSNAAFTTPFVFPKVDPETARLIESGDSMIKAQKEVLKTTADAISQLKKIPNPTPEQKAQIKALEVRQKEAEAGLDKNIKQRDALIAQQQVPTTTLSPNLIFGTPSTFGLTGNLNFNNNGGIFSNVFSSNPNIRGNITPINQAEYRAKILQSLKTTSDPGSPLDYPNTPEETAKIRELDQRIKAVEDNKNLNKLGKAKLVEELRNQKLEIFADAMTRDAVAKQYSFNATIRLPQSVLNQLNNSTIVPISPLTQLNTGIITKLPEGTIPLEINNSLAGAKFSEIFKPITVDPKTLIDLPGDKNNSTVKVGDKVYQLKYAQTSQGLVGIVIGEDGKYNTINSSDPRVQSYLNQNTVVNGKAISIRQILSTGFNPADLLGEKSNNVEDKVYSELPKANTSLKAMLPNRTMISSLELKSLVPQVGKDLLAALPKEFKDSLPYQTYSGTISNQELDLLTQNLKTNPKLAQELSNFNKVISDIQKSTGLTRAQIAQRLDTSVDGLALRRMLEITDLYGDDNKLQVSDLQRVKGVEVGSVVIQGARTVIDARNNTAIQSGLLGYGLFINPENKALFDNTLGVRDNGIPMVFRKAIGTVRDYSTTGMRGNGASDRFDSESYSKMVSAWKDFKAGKLDDIALDPTTLAQIRAVLSTKGVNLTNEQAEEIIFMKYYLDHIENGQNWAWGRLGVGDFKPGKDLLQEYQTNFAKYNKVDTSQNINTNVKTTSADLAINQEGLKDIMQNPFKAVSAAVSLLTGSGTIGVQITNEQNIENAFTGKRASAAKYDDASKTITIDRNKLGGDAPTAVQLLQIAKGLGLDSSIPFAIMSGSHTESSSTSATVGSIKVEIVGQPSRAEQAVTGAIIQNLRDNAKAIYRDDMDPKVSLYKAVAANLDQLRAQGKLTDAEYKISIDLAQKSSEFVLTYKERIRLTNPGVSSGSLGDLGVLAQTQGYTVTGYTVPIKDATRTTIGLPVTEIKKLEGGDIYAVSQKLFNASGKTMGMSDADAANMASQLIDLRRNAVSAGRLSSASELQSIKVPEGFELLTKKMSVAAKSGIVTESTLPNGKKVYVLGTVHTGLNGQGQIDGRIIDQTEDPDIITLRDKKTGREILIARNSPNCPQADLSIEYDTASISVDCRQTGNCTPLELDMLRGRLTANQDTLNTVVVMNQASLNTDRAFTGGAQELVKAISAAEKTNAAIAKPLSDVLKNPTPEALTRFQQETGVVIDPAIAQTLSKQGMILDAQTTMVSIVQQYKEKFGVDIGPMMIGFNWGDSGKIDAKAEVSLRITGLTAETERDANGILRYKLDANGQPIPCFNVEVTALGKSSKEWENKGSIIIQLPIPKPPKPPEPPKREIPKVRDATKPVNPNTPTSTPPPGPNSNPFVPRTVNPNIPPNPNSPLFQPPDITNPNLAPTTIPNTGGSIPTFNTPVSTPLPVTPVPNTIPVVPTPTPNLPVFNNPTSTGVVLGS